MVSDTGESRNDCLLVGIAGGTAAGKSTLAARLESVLTEMREDLHVRVLRCDGYFYREGEERRMYSSSYFGREMADFNHPDALNISQLAADLDGIHREEPGIILVEGHLLFSIPDIRERLDLRIYVDLDDDTRALRRMVRNLSHKGDPIPDHSAASIAAYYLESAKTGHDRFIGPSRGYADLIVRGDADFDRVAPMLAGAILTRINEPSK